MPCAKSVLDLSLCVLLLSPFVFGAILFGWLGVSLPSVDHTWGIGIGGHGIGSTPPAPWPSHPFPATVPKEVVVIGAGAVGLASAYYLSREGHRVTVLEKEEGVGRVASHRNGASRPHP